ncbi:lipopolysaccharide transport periplasmic protein LptA [bacterium]|nr:MAG: lipopolysaccharide transport periplasmic protein LptA [bacterium]
MSRAFFIIKNVFFLLLSITFILSVASAQAVKGDSIVITSQKLTADNKQKTAVFEGLVVAKTKDIFIYSDRMEVVYDNTEGRIKKIRAVGNVRVHNKNRAIFSEEALYFGEEGKIVFNGEPKAVEGENVITGTQIIYFLKDDRTVVKGSRVVLKTNQE